MENSIQMDDLGVPPILGIESRYGGFLKWGIHKTIGWNTKIV